MTNQASFRTQSHLLKRGFASGSAKRLATVKREGVARKGLALPDGPEPSRPLILRSHTRSPGPRVWVKGRRCLLVRDIRRPIFDSRHDARREAMGDRFEGLRGASGRGPYSCISTHCDKAISPTSGKKEYRTLSPVWIWRLMLFTHTLTSTRWPTSSITKQSKAPSNLSKKRNFANSV